VAEKLKLDKDILKELKVIGSGYYNMPLALLSIGERGKE